jgi:hypothetical protein
LCHHILIALRYVDNIDSVDDVDPNDAPLLMCLVEQLRGGMGADERVNIGMIAICPSTGDVVWDDFEGKCFIGRFSDVDENSQATLRWPHAYRARGEFYSEFAFVCQLLAIHLSFSDEDGAL